MTEKDSNVINETNETSPTQTQRWKSPFTFSTYYKYSMNSQELIDSVVVPVKKLCFHLYSSEKSLYNYLTDNRVINIPKQIIAESNERRYINIKIGSESDKALSFTIAPRDRLITLLALTTLSTFIHNYRINFKKFRYRMFLPYFFIYSVLIYREALNPFLY